MALGFWLLAFVFWLLAFGFWLLAFWLLAFGLLFSFSCFETISDLPLPLCLVLSTSLPLSIFCLSRLFAFRSNACLPFCSKRTAPCGYGSCSDILVSFVLDSPKTHTKKASMDYITSLPFDGFAIVGSIETSREELYDMIGYGRGGWDGR